MSFVHSSKTLQRFEPRRASPEGLTAEERDEVKVDPQPPKRQDGRVQSREASREPERVRCEYTAWRRRGNQAVADGAHPWQSYRCEARRTSR